MLRWTGVAAAILAGLTLIVIGGGLGVSVASGDASGYAAARRCPSDATGSDSCFRELPMQVVEASTEGASPLVNGTRPYTWQLRLTAGGSSSTTTIGPAVQPPLAGSTVTARVWRGRVVQITSARSVYRTFAYPVAPPAWLPPLLMILGLGALALAVAAALRRI